MQGSGTQTDPFYPTNWSEFVTAIGTENAYVECPENDMWDMNEILPDGLRSNILWIANTVYGNGLTINNLCFNGGKFDFGNPNYNPNIYRVNFLNMTTLGNSSDMFYFYVSSGYRNGKIYFNNCKFSGLISSGSVFTAMYPIYLTHDNEKSCSLNFDFTGNGTLCGFYPPYFKYCNIKLDGKSTGNGEMSRDEGFEKCYISGKCPWKYIQISGYDNILDIEIPNDSKITTRPVEYMRSSVLNIDKMHGSYGGSYTYSKYIEVTGAQLSDAAYLQSKGFSIAG